jgi:hypothetical protein
MFNIFLQKMYYAILKCFVVSTCLSFQKPSQRHNVSNVKVSLLFR